MKGVLLMLLSAPALAVTITNPLNEGPTFFGAHSTSTERGVAGQGFGDASGELDELSVFIGGLHTEFPTPDDARQIVLQDGWGVTVALLRPFPPPISTSDARNLIDPDYWAWSEYVYVPTKTISEYDFFPDIALPVGSFFVIIPDAPITGDILGGAPFGRTLAATAVGTSFHCGFPGLDGAECQADNNFDGVAFTAIFSNVREPQEFMLLVLVGMMGIAAHGRRIRKT